MKIAVSASEGSLDAQVDERFGRGKHFVVVDTDTMEVSVLENTQNFNAVQGAGVQSAANVANSGAEYVLTGHCGPKAFQVLGEAGVKVIVGVKGSIRDAVEAFNKGEYKPTEDADVSSHW